LSSVCWWAWSPILELQTREQLSHGQALRLLRGWTPFRTALLCSRASTRESSNWVTAAWHRVLQAERSCVSLLRADGSMLHCFILTFRASLYRETGPHCRRFPIASCPRNTCFGIRPDTNTSLHAKRRETGLTQTSVVRINRCDLWLKCLFAYQNASFLLFLHLYFTR